jgi:hypothetical protein
MLFPPNILSAYLLVCQQALHETDGVVSAVRIVDFFQAKIQPDVPIERQALFVFLVGGIRLQHSAVGEHRWRIDLVRPDGKITQGDETLGACTQHGSGAPPGINFVLSLGVIPKQMGNHCFILYFDGEEVARAPFTILALAPSA